VKTRRTVETFDAPPAAATLEYHGPFVTSSPAAPHAPAFGSVMGCVEYSMMNGGSVPVPPVCSRSPTLRLVSICYRVGSNLSHSTWSLMVPAVVLWMKVALTVNGSFCPITPSVSAPFEALAMLLKKLYAPAGGGV